MVSAISTPVPAGPLPVWVRLSTFASLMKRTPLRRQASARPRVNLWMSPVESDGVKKPP